MKKLKFTEAFALKCARAGSLNLKHMRIVRASVLTRAWVSLGISAMLLIRPGWAAVDADFDHVFPSVYSDLLYDGKTAYNDKRYDRAFPLLRKASCAGDKESQWLLGHMYLLGQGVERNDLEGYAWLKASAEVQWAEYRTTVDRIESAISRQQRPVADAEAKKIIDAYGLAATGMSCGKAASRKGHIMDRIMCSPRSEGTLVLLKRCAGVSDQLP